VSDFLEFSIGMFLMFVMITFQGIYQIQPCWLSEVQGREQDFPRWCQC